jgi:zinc/manganese transport system substrate-binding protein
MHANKRINHYFLRLFLGFLVLLLAACQTSTPATSQNGKKTIVVTYSILGAVVKDLVGDQANVVVSMPNGQDPHEWEPSAKDIETLTHADLIVQNGLGLEGGMEKSLAQAKEAGVKFFTASDHITIRKVGSNEGIPNGDPDQVIGASDPHLWTDPLAMKEIVIALAGQIQSELGLDVSAQAKDLETRLDALNQEIVGLVNALPESDRKMVTGHESLGYFAQRYGFKLIGAIVPSLTTQAEVSASELANLKKLIADNQVKAIFTELGTPANVSESIGKETGVRVIQVTTHNLPQDGSYFTFMRNLANTIVTGLK